ncbi:uncharacterized protein LOC131662865 [Phymastichus coffea]|uniref:uncharacterized protein LOC131662865 n=1 Tax=Phymastichus coffea TaxID=108790 RepID=UPI00273BBF83|nr:uncharacterized protein LOC131662865 [Phymastichus coffea]
MVADKSKFDRVLVDQLQCGDVIENSTNLDKNRSNSSEIHQSLKCHCETKDHSDQSLDSNDKDESGDKNQKMFNSTYLCSKPLGVNGNKIDQMIDKDDEYPNLSILQTAENTVKLKYSSSSYMQNLDNTQWNDLKRENLSIEDLIIVKEMENESVLMKIRKYLVDYQELRGISCEEYSFSTLIRILGQATGRCLFALFYVVLNIAPAILEIFLHIVRFVLDKVIYLKETENVKQIIMKMSIFAAQITCIYICLVFIFGVIVWPVIHMAFDILTKIMLYD